MERQGILVGRLENHINSLPFLPHTTAVSRVFLLLSRDQGF